jgi:hypothetical protein
MSIALPVKQVFDRLLSAPGQTIFLGGALEVFKRRFGFRARFTASPYEVQAVLSRRDTRAGVAQEMMRLNGIRNISTHSDEKAAVLGAMLGRRLSKSLNTHVAQQVASGVLLQLQLAATLAAPAHASVDLFRSVRPAIQEALLEGFLGAPLTVELKAQINDLPAAPDGIEGVAKVFVFAICAQGLALEKILPPVAFEGLLRFCLPKVSATRIHHQNYSAIVRAHLQTSANLSRESWLCDLQNEFSSGRLSSVDLDGEIAAIFDVSYALSLAVMWSVFCVASEPEQQEKLRIQSQGEVDRNCQLQNHARLCALEALRLYPPFYMLAFTASQRPEKDANPKAPGCPMRRLGLRAAPPDTVVSVQGLHRNPKIWHRAGDYWPERFQGVGLDEQKKTPRGAFIPFGVGHRACPGRALSMMVIERVLLAIFGAGSTVSIDLPNGIPKPKRNALLMAKDPRITVRLS